MFSLAGKSWHIYCFIPMARAKKSTLKGEKYEHGKTYGKKPSGDAGRA